MARITKKPEERKAEIMETAEALFISNGFENVAVSDIVKKIGVAQGTFYYYFESKDDLLNQILDNSLAMLELQADHIIANTEMDPVGKLKAVLYMAFFSGLGKKNMVSHMDEERNAELHRRMEKKFFEKFYPRIAEVVMQGKEKGRFDTGYPEEITQIVIMGMQGYMHINYAGFSDRAFANEKMKAAQEVIERVLGLEKDTLVLQLQDFKEKKL